MSRPEFEAISERRLVYNAATGFHEARAVTEKFIRGPIPLNWVCQANALPGKAGVVGLALWFLVGVQKSMRIKLTGEVERIAGCERKALYFALRALEQVGLITDVVRSPGARPSLTVSVRGPDQDSQTLAMPASPTYRS